MQEKDERAEKTFAKKCRSKGVGANCDGLKSSEMDKKNTESIRRVFNDHEYRELIPWPTLTHLSCMHRSSVKR